MRLFCLALVAAGLALGADGTAVNPRQVVVFTGDIELPQVVGGNYALEGGGEGSWQTTIQLMNMGTVPAHVYVDFYGDDGNWLPFQVVGEASSTHTVEKDIPVGGSVRIETAAGSGIPLTVGYAEVTTADDTQLVGGMAILRQKIPGRDDFEAVVPIESIYDTRVIFPFDNVPPYTTAFAIVNPYETQASVAVTVRDEAGNQLYSEVMTLEPYEHKNFTMHELWATATDNQRGAIEFQTSNTDGISAMGLRFNDSGAFTSFHGLTSADWIVPAQATVTLNPSAMSARPVHRR